MCIRTCSIGIIRGVKLVNLGFLSRSSFFFPVVYPTFCVSFFLSRLSLVHSSLFLFPFIFFCKHCAFCIHVLLSFIEQLEVFFQRIEEWFDALSKQLTALAVGSQPQNYHPNPCFLEEEKDLDIEQEGYDIKEDDEYIERVYLVNWDSPPIYDDYPEDFS